MKSRTGGLFAVWFVLAACGAWPPPIVTPPVTLPVTPPVTPPVVNCEPVRPDRGSVLIGVVGKEAIFGVPGPQSRCDQAQPSDVRVSGPNGESLVGVRASVSVVGVQLASGGVNMRQADVTFTPSAPGLWKISVTWSTGATTTREVLASTSHVASMSSRRFVDRMDTCTRGPYRTLGGLVLCQRVAEIWVYRPDGEIDQSFHGNELVVRGNEVWSNRGDQLEHRSDVQGQLRFDGAIWTGPSLGYEAETRSGVALRYVETGLQGVGTREVLEARWTGAQLTSAFHATVPDLWSPMMVYEGGATWTTTSSTCLFEPGCQQTRCDSVVTCIDSGYLFSSGQSQLGTSALWNVGGRYHPGFAFLSALARPIRLGVPALELTLATTDRIDVYNMAPGFELPRFTVGQTVFLPRLEDSKFQLSQFGVDGTLVTMTDDWVISISTSSPFTLLFARTPQ